MSNTSIPSILVIEDDEDLGELVTFILNEEGYPATLVRDGEEAMTTLQECEPAVIVLDIHLPGISGIDILDYVRSEGRLDDTRVLVTTADPKMVTRCEGTADVVYCKPYTVADLVGGIGRLTNRAISTPE